MTQPTLPRSARLLQELVSILAIASFIFMVGMIVYIGVLVGVSMTRKEAVKAGVAEWVLVDDSGNSGFRWKSLGTASTTISLEELNATPETIETE